MKKFGLLCFSIAAVHFSFAQVHVDSAKTIKPNIASVGVNMGMCLAPEAVFKPASNLYWTDFIQPGFSVNVSGQVALCHSHFGLAGQFSYYTNSFNMNKFIGYYQGLYPSATITSIAYGSFAQYSSLVGAYASVVCHKFTVELRVLGGIDYLSLPNNALSVKMPPPDYSFNDTYNYKSGIGLAGGADISLSYAISPSVSATLSLDALLTKVSYTDTEYHNFNFVDYIYPGSATAQVFMFTTTLGVSYRFGK